jgi:Tfp pilus assembly protein PilF
MRRPLETWTLQALTRRGQALGTPRKTAGSLVGPRRLFPLWPSLLGIAAAVLFPGFLRADAPPLDLRGPGAAAGQNAAQRGGPERAQRPASEPRHEPDGHAPLRQQPPSTGSFQPHVRPLGLTLWYYPGYGSFYPYGYPYLPGGTLGYGIGYYSSYPPPAWAWTPPPLWIPWQTPLGPDPTRRLPGVERGPVAESNGEQGRGREAAANMRGTGAEAVAFGWRFIHLGDGYFRNGKYSFACDRYRSAVQAAPRLADAHFRLGFALAALGRYDSAVKELDRGLEIQPNWAQSEFRLADIYGDNEQAKKAHLEAIAKAADDRGASSDLLFLIGVYLHFDGQPDRARPFFQRASQLAGGNVARLGPFVAPARPEEE